MKKLIFILMLIAVSVFAQKKEPLVKAIPSFNNFTHCEVLALKNDGVQDYYSVNLGVKEINEDGKLVFVSKMEGSYYIVSKAPFKLTKKELDKLNGVVE